VHVNHSGEHLLANKRHDLFGNRECTEAQQSLKVNSTYKLPHRPERITYDVDVATFDKDWVIQVRNERVVVINVGWIDGGSACSMELQRIHRRLW
jgi:hypothetical protein